MSGSCCGGSGIAIWRPKLNQWECSECGAPKSNDPDYLYSNQGRNPPPEYLQNIFDKSCTCGAEKTHGVMTGHSSWCDKGEK